MARDCTGDPANKHHPLKNILKDDDMQHGGDNNSRLVIIWLFPPFLPLFV